MKRIHYLSWSVLLIASGAYSAADTAPNLVDAPLTVKTVHKTHILGYGAKPAPGPSKLLKTHAEDTNASLVPKIVRTPQQGAGDEK